MSSDDLIVDVTNELFWDPKVDNEAIAVSADDGKITLRGTVGSFRQKREAKKDAERVFGVISVDNKLQVRLLDSTRREDADIRGDVLQALMLDGLVPSTIDVKVSEGYVTLTGTAEWQYQRAEAEYVASAIVGVLDIEDTIKVANPKPKASDIETSIDGAFKRNAKLDADDLTVTSSNGTIRVSGFVNSWSEHDEAIDAVWAAPGVNDVEDLIIVQY
jgi:osmotically-inducible protein OsmY